MHHFLVLVLLFTYCRVAIALETTQLGVGNTVNYMNETLLLHGIGLHTGQTIPRIGILSDNRHITYTTDNFEQKTLYFLVPSVDEPTSTKNILEVYNKTRHLNARIMFISTDSIHTLARFKAFYNLNNVTFLTDSRTHSFGLKTGTLIRDWGELTRAIIITDKNNKVISIQAVKNLLDLPCIVKALNLM